MAQVAHLRRRIEPHIAVLHHSVGWERAEDPIEALRQLRVATRRLRAFTRLFGPIIGPEPSRRLYKQLRKVTRAVGPLRESDVLLDGLRAEHARAEPLLRAALESVIIDAQRQRDRAARKARKTVSKIDVLPLAEALDQQLDRVCGRLLRLDEGLPARAWTLLRPVLERAFDQLPHPRHDHEVEPLHEVRVRAKRLRYALELLRPTLGEAYRPLRKPAKQIQRAIGEHHDHSLLAQTLHEQADALADQGLTTLADALRPLEQRLLAERRAAHEAARPALEQLVRQRYVTLATTALGIELEPDPAEPDPDPAEPDPAEPSTEASESGPPRDRAAPGA